MRRTLVALMSFFWLSGCASVHHNVQQATSAVHEMLSPGVDAYKRGLDLRAAGARESALTAFEEALRKDAKNERYRAAVQEERRILFDRAYAKAHAVPSLALRERIAALREALPYASSPGHIDTEIASLQGQLASVLSTADSTRRELMSGSLASALAKLTTIHTYSSTMPEVREAKQAIVDAYDTALASIKADVLAHRYDAALEKLVPFLIIFPESAEAVELQRATTTALARIQQEANDQEFDRLVALGAEASNDTPAVALYYFRRAAGISTPRSSSVQSRIAETRDTLLSEHRDRTVIAFSDSVPQDHRTTFTKMLTDVVSPPPAIVELGPAATSSLRFGD